MKHWQQQDAYDYTNTLSAPRWAWEFLRRNPEYQYDWKNFNQRWQALEQDYGKAPHRDFSRWKNDARAVVSQQESQLICADDIGITCATEDNKLLIECWMGAKWGFYKFPLNPNYRNPQIPKQLLWREHDISLEKIAQENTNQAHIYSIPFDLRYNLKDQLDMARIQLAKVCRQQYKTQKIKLSIKDNVQYWTYQLRYADAIQAGTHTTEALHYLQAETTIPLDKLPMALEKMWQGEYLDILLLKS